MTKNDGKTTSRLSLTELLKALKYEKKLAWLVINAAMWALKAELNDPDAHIIFSADFDDSLAGDLQVSLILNREEG